MITKIYELPLLLNSGPTAWINYELNKWQKQDSFHKDSDDRAICLNGSLCLYRWSVSVFLKLNMRSTVVVGVQLLRENI